MNSALTVNADDLESTWLADNSVTSLRTHLALAPFSPAVRIVAPSTRRCKSERLKSCKLHWSKKDAPVLAVSTRVLRIRLDSNAMPRESVSYGRVESCPTGSWWLDWRLHSPPPSRSDCNEKGSRSSLLRT